MKLIYILAFFFGLSFQFIDYAEPRDAVMASVLSRSTNHWSISMDETLQARLPDHNVKQELISTLASRVAFRSEMFSESATLSFVVMGFSVVGLVREMILGRALKTLAQKSTQKL